MNKMETKIYEIIKDLDIDGIRLDISEDSTFATDKRAYFILFDYEVNDWSSLSQCISIYEPGWDDNDDFVIETGDFVFLTDSTNFVPDEDTFLEFSARGLAGLALLKSCITDFEKYKEQIINTIKESTRT